MITLFSFPAFPFCNRQLANSFITLKSTYNWLDIVECDLNFLDLLWGKLDFLWDFVFLERYYLGTTLTYPSVLNGLNNAANHPSNLSNTQGF